MKPEDRFDPSKDPDARDYKETRDDLFGDLEDDEQVTKEDTVESLRKERDDLLKQVGTLSEQVMSYRNDLAGMGGKVAEARQSLKRAEEKFETDKKFAVGDFVKEMLPVVDNFERALGAIPKKLRENDSKFDKLAEGVEKTLNQLKTVFNKFGVQEINPIHQQFDENKHEVLTVQPKAGVEPETVIHVMEKGYEIEGRIIRPAKVIVTPPD
jgi:molecular chaperone GrpE